MRTDRPLSSTSADARAAGWIASLILHGTLALGAFVFAQQIKLAPPTTPFTWDVAMVAPAPQATAASSPTTQRSAPPAPVTEPTAKPVPTKTETAAQPLETFTPTVDTGLPTPSALRQIEEQVPHPAAEQTPFPRTTERMEHDSSHTDQAAHASTLSAPSLQASSAPAGSVPSVHDDIVAVPKDALSPQQAAAFTEPQVAALGQAGQAKSVKADYGWLADLMAKWIGELDKRYPAMLRTEGITGRVTLTAILHQDGMLSEVRVAKSSGNALLDQVAVEDIQNGPPVKLPRPLERPSMPVKFSIVYDLKTAR